MASFVINGFDEVDEVFSKASRPEYFLRAVESAAPYLVDAVQSVIESTQGGGRKLARSFSATKARTNQYGTYVFVVPTGYDKNGNHWATRAACLEYGTVWPRSKKNAEKIHHLNQRGLPKNPPHPWRDRSLNKARSKCEEAMRETMYAEIDKAWT